MSPAAAAYRLHLSPAAAAAACDLHSGSTADACILSRLTFLIEFSQELKELRIEQDSLFDSGNTDKKKAESMSKVVGALARDKAELEEALDETQQQLEESYAECDELRDALEWLEANGTQRNDGTMQCCPCVVLYDTIVGVTIRLPRA